MDDWIIFLAFRHCFLSHLTVYSAQQTISPFAGTALWTNDPLRKHLKSPKTDLTVTHFLRWMLRAAMIISYTRLIFVFHYILIRFPTQIDAISLDDTKVKSISNPSVFELDKQRWFTHATFTAHLKSKRYTIIKIRLAYIIIRIYTSNFRLNILFSSWQTSFYVIYF